MAITKAKIVEKLTEDLGLHVRKRGKQPTLFCQLLNQRLSPVKMS
jgi:hypothetical protein